MASLSSSPALMLSVSSVQLFLFNDNGKCNKCRSFAMLEARQSEFESRPRAYKSLGDIVSQLLAGVDQPSTTSPSRPPLQILSSW